MLSGRIRETEPTVEEQRAARNGTWSRSERPGHSGHLPPLAGENPPGFSSVSIDQNRPDIAIEHDDFLAGLGAVLLDDLDDLAQRLEDAGWSVTREPTELLVEQFDERYRVTAEGTVDGEGEFRGPLENLVETVHG